MRMSRKCGRQGTPAVARERETSAACQAAMKHWKSFTLGAVDGALRGSRGMEFLRLDGAGRMLWPRWCVAL